jgi:hypothetical protein
LRRAQSQVRNLECFGGGGIVLLMQRWTDM